MNRIAFMDSMRSVLMMLGVVLHSCNVYNTKHSWLIYGNSSTFLADYAASAIHVFRMPSFFAVSGYFCAYALSKYDFIKFIKVRLARIVVPLVVTAVTLNSLQALILSQTGYQDHSIASYFRNGSWVSHLWFLNNLIVYFLLALTFSRVLTRLLRSVRQRLHWISSTPVLGIIALMPITQLAITALGKMGIPVYSSLFNVFDVYEIISYLPYFAFGCILGANPDLFERFIKTPLIYAVGMITSTALAVHVSSLFSNVGMASLQMYLNTLLSWASVLLCFSIFHSFFDSSSSLWFFLSDASYTVYLFHHVLVIALGYVCIRWDVTPVPGIIFLILTTTTITLLIHKYMVLPSKVMRFLFNGK